MDVKFELRPKSGELRPQYNTQGGPITRENALEFDPDDHTLVNIRIETVQYGKYNGEHASLILLRFVVIFRPGYRRIRTFNVKAEFSSIVAGEVTSAPKVISLAPENCPGKIFTAESTNADGNAEKGTTYADGQNLSNKHRDVTLNGWRKSSTKYVDNVVVWDCVEGKKPSRGVIPAYRGAILLRLEEDTSFQAHFKLHADVGIINVNKHVFDWMDFFGNRKDDPVIFNRSEPLGPQYPIMEDFQKLNLNDFTSFDGSWTKVAKTGTAAMVTKPNVVEILAKKNAGIYKAFRIRNVPMALAVSDIKQICSKQVSSSPLIASLAPEADSFNRDRYQVATATFQPLITPLLDLKPVEKVRFNYEDTGNRESSLVIDCWFLGLTTLANPLPGRIISMDLVAVTGLSGHPLASWKELNGSYIWIRDGLPEALPNARILTYGYDSKIVESASFASISDYGKSLLTELQAARARPEESESQRPLVFIGHSLGGLLVKEALVHSSRAESDAKNVFNSTRGLFFLGVPHRGLRVEHLLAMAESQPNEDFIQSLKPESPYLNILYENFVQATKEKDWIIHTYFETLESPTAKWVGDAWKMVGPPQRLVSQSSATGATPDEDSSHQHPMNCTHSAMAKFDENDINYRGIRSLLISISQNLASS